ncbi:hypothetical protein GCM10007385_45040 [Tateyamaria omphalii]|nr:hypothetical protein GCM10007385_45040 [Tateyamaria omphalii]
MTPVLFEWIEGEPIANDDALEAGWHVVQDVLEGRLAQSQNVDATLRSAIAFAINGNSKKPHQVGSVLPRIISM